jgi:hypothetical protein
LLTPASAAAYAFWEPLLRLESRELELVKASVEVTSTESTSITAIAMINAIPLSSDTRRRRRRSRPKVVRGLPQESTPM